MGSVDQPKRCCVSFPISLCGTSTYSPTHAHTSSSGGFAHVCTHKLRNMWISYEARVKLGQLRSTVIFPFMYVYAHTFSSGFYFQAFVSLYKKNVFLCYAFAPPLSCYFLFSSIHSFCNESMWLLIRRGGRHAFLVPDWLYQVSLSSFILLPHFGTEYNNFVHLTVFNV